MFSKREREGYLLIDHRLGYGITPEEALAARARCVPVEAGKIFESPTFTCSHCFPAKVVVMNPDRTRPRGYCPKCDWYVCDQCETTRVLTGECVPRQKRTDQWFEAAVKGEVDNGT